MWLYYHILFLHLKSEFGLRIYLNPGEETELLYSETISFALILNRSQLGRRHSTTKNTIVFLALECNSKRRNP